MAATGNAAKNGSVSPHRRHHKASDADDAAPFHGVLGSTHFGCVVFSNGDEDHFSHEAAEAFDMRLPFSHNFHIAARKAGFASGKDWADVLQHTGIKWQCVELARRYLLLSKAVWLRSVPVAEAIWKVDDALSLATGERVPMQRHENGKAVVVPVVGDLVIWRRTREVPFGHVAIVVGVTVAASPCCASPPKDTEEQDPEATDAAPSQLAPPTTTAATVVRGTVSIVEQNHSFVPWRDDAHSRTLSMICRSDGSIELTDHDQDPILGWMRVHAPDVDFVAHDIADNFRTPTTAGSILRIVAERDPTLPWLQPHDSPCDFFLKRSLVINGNLGEGAMAAEKDVPDGCYIMDGDMWSHIRKAAHSLHDVAMTATWRVVNDPRAPSLLEHYFGIPRELHALVRDSLQRLPCMFGRFDFGYDGERVKMLEYNCDSSAALYECSDTQDKWSRHMGADYSVGHSTGSFLRSKVLEYFNALRENAQLCPPSKLIHFMVDDDDEERYTALCVARCAQDCGFRVKMCVKLTDFRFAERPPRPQESTASLRRSINATTPTQTTATAATTAVPCTGTVPTCESVAAQSLEEHELGACCECHHSATCGRAYLDQWDVVDLEGDVVELVWKTWSWDTVIRQYTLQRNERCHPSAGTSDGSGSNNGSAAIAQRPSLSDILLNQRIGTLEPFWKMITGSKALLPFMHEVAPEHPNMVYASFARTERLLKQPYLSKPVNGRAGQNITMLDAVPNAAERRSIAVADELHHRPYLASSAMSDKAGSTTHTPLGDDASASRPAWSTTEDGNETSEGRFFNSLVVYQRRVNLKKFAGMYYPIFCAWVVGDQFGGVAVREDTSKITKLGSIVAPTRVVRW